MFKKLLGMALVAASIAFSPPARAVDLSLDGNLRGLCGTATASAGAATLANKCGVITSEALTTAAAAVYTLTLTNTVIAAADILLVSVGGGTNTTVGPSLAGVAPAAGSAVIVVRNTHASSALNGTITIRYMVIKP